MAQQQRRRPAPCSMADFEALLNDICDSIPIYVLQGNVNSMKHRLTHCMEVDGGAV